MVTALLAKGVSDDEVLAIFRSFPVGDRFRERSKVERYLALLIQSQRAYLASDAPRTTGQGALPRWVIDEFRAAQALQQMWRLMRALHQGPQSMKDIARRTGLARNTVKKHVDMGIQLGWVKPAPPAVPKGRGRPGVSYALTTTAPVHSPDPRAEFRAWLDIVRDLCSNPSTEGDSHDHEDSHDSEASTCAVETDG